jgi:putative FmdB family regulatory protein
MPIYEYECSECGVHFEKLQKFSDPNPETCPNGHKQVQRRLSQPTIIFKGKGFYVTDNGHNGRHKPTPKKERDPAKSTTTTPATEAKEGGGGGRKGEVDAKDAG